MTNTGTAGVWQTQPAAFFEEAFIEADGTVAETTGACRVGRDIGYNGTCGYHPLLVSLANTAEPVYVVNRGGNRPSGEAAAARFDQALTLCRDAGFRRMTFHDGTDFTQMGIWIAGTLPASDSASGPMRARTWSAPRRRCRARPGPRWRSPCDTQSRPRLASGRRT
jgi:hypothetical protein